MNSSSFSPTCSNIASSRQLLADGEGLKVSNVTHLKGDTSTPNSGHRKEQGSSAAVQSMFEGEGLKVSSAAERLVCEM
jgi:hypothetical protein